METPSLEGIAADTQRSCGLTNMTGQLCLNHGGTQVYEGAGKTVIKQWCLIDLLFPMTHLEGPALGGVVSKKEGGVPRTSVRQCSDVGGLYSLWICPGQGRGPSSQVEKACYKTHH